MWSTDPQWLAAISLLFSTVFKFNSLARKLHTIIWSYRRIDIKWKKYSKNIKSYMYKRIYLNFPSTINHYLLIWHSFILLLAYITKMLHPLLILFMGDYIHNATVTVLWWFSSFSSWSEPYSLVPSPIYTDSLYKQSVLQLSEILLSSYLHIK